MRDKGRMYYGVGFIPDDVKIVTEKNKKNKSYETWLSVFSRVYNKKYHLKKPTYVGCSIDEHWYNFKNFNLWYEENYIEGFQLDKDILVKGNKIYSPETCCFVPQEINCLFTKSDSKRGNTPIGVYTQGKRYISIHNKKRLGLFNTPEEAFQAYKFAKEDWIKEIADKWRGKISELTYLAMYNYQVEITD